MEKIELLPNKFNILESKLVPEKDIPIIKQCGEEGILNDLFYFFRRIKFKIRSLIFNYKFKRTNKKIFKILLKDSHIFKIDSNGEIFFKIEIINKNKGISLHSKLIKDFTLYHSEGNLYSEKYNYRHNKIRSISITIIKYF